MSKLNSTYGLGRQAVEMTIETFNEEHREEIIDGAFQESDERIPRHAVLGVELQADGRGASLAA